MFGREGRKQLYLKYDILSYATAHAPRHRCLPLHHEARSAQNSPAHANTDTPSPLPPAQCTRTHRHTTHCKHQQQQQQQQQHHSTQGKAPGGIEPPGGVKMSLPSPPLPHSPRRRRGGAKRRHAVTCEEAAPRSGRSTPNITASRRRTFWYQPRTQGGSRSRAPACATRRPSPQTPLCAPAPTASVAPSCCTAPSPPPLLMAPPAAAGRRNTAIAIRHCYLDSPVGTVR
jgi:hypothetical protein